MALPHHQVGDEDLLRYDVEEMEHSEESSSSSSSVYPEEEFVPHEPEPRPGPSGGGTGGEAFVWPSNRPHPLLIPDILRDVLDLLEMKDVETCREVCRGWNGEACSVLQDKKLVAFLDSDAAKYYIQKMEGTPYYPHSQFELHMDNVSDKQSLMRSFWTSFGANIRNLEFHQPIFFQEVLFSLLEERLPNLERLTLKALPRKSTRRNSHPPAAGSSSQANQNQNQHQVPEDEGPHIFPSLREIGFSWFPQDDAASSSVIKELLQSMPNLETISLNINQSANIIPRGDGLLSSKLRAARLLLRVIIDPEVHLPQLKNIDFELEVGNAELESLTEKGYQFRTISLKLATGTRSAVLKDYLTMLSPHLRNLEIFFPSGFFSGGITFPACFQMRPQELGIHLKEVTVLSLHNFRGSLTFIRNLDRLKRLTVNNSNFDTSLQSFGYRADDVMSALRRESFDHTLESFRTDSIARSPVVSNLSNCFPLLRILHVKGIDDDGLGIVYRNLPYLVELMITDGKCSDQGISGVPLEVCVDMAETVTFKCVNPEKYRRDLFLGSLQYLKTLLLHGEEITDVSIAFGIVDCKNLRDLTIRAPAISDTGLIKIADRLNKQLHRLDVIYCGNVTEEGKFYVREKMKGITLLIEPQTAVQSQRARVTGNRHRQVGYPFRGRLVRPNEEFVAHVDNDEYGRAPIRARVEYALDRRRRLHQRAPRMGIFHQNLEDLGIGRRPPPALQEQMEFMLSDDEEDNDIVEMEMHNDVFGAAAERERRIVRHFRQPNLLAILAQEAERLNRMGAFPGEEEEDDEDIADAAPGAE